MLQTGQYSTQIFSLAVLLSSLFVYNQMGGIDEAALDRLSLVTEVRHCTWLWSTMLYRADRPAHLWLARANIDVLPSSRSQSTSACGQAAPPARAAAGSWPPSRPPLCGCCVTFTCRSRTRAKRCFLVPFECGKATLGTFGTCSVKCVCSSAYRNLKQ